MRNLAVAIEPAVGVAREMTMMNDSVLVLVPKGIGTVLVRVGISYVAYNNPQKKWTPLQYVGTMAYIKLDEACSCMQRARIGQECTWLVAKL